MASRKSDLARIQAFSVGDALKAAHPELEIEFQFRESLGDKNLSDPLWKMPERGVFTEDFYADLVEGKCDLVVHSWKDLPVETRAHTEIAATLERADMRDLLLMRKDRWLKASKSGEVHLLSSSPRREYNLGVFFKTALPFKTEKPVSLHFEPVRGNVPTRIEKLFAGDCDGLIVAKAAIDRLLGAKRGEFAGLRARLQARLGELLFMVLPLGLNPTAAAQGALALEIRRGRDDIKKILAPVHSEGTFRAAMKEREILASYGGGCHQKVGVSVLERSYGQVVYVRAKTDEGIEIERFEFFPRETPVKVSGEKLFPLEGGGQVWFERERLSVTQLPDGPLWVAKAEALPENVLPGFGQVVWVSGLETWKKLASRGVWVNGSSESLGESEDPKLAELLGGEPMWTKLSHQGAPQGHYGMKLLATYKLVPLSSGPDLSGKSHFYWSSASSFDQALAWNPWIADARHACGPGNTYDSICSRLGSEARLKVQVFPSHKSWLQWVSK